MREAVIILPRANASATATLRARLLAAFGGYTEHKARGAWRDPDTGKIHFDNSSVFAVAVDDENGGHMLNIRDMAMEAGKLAGQISVYVKGFDGNVEFVNCAWAKAEDQFAKVTA